LFQNDTRKRLIYLKRGFMPTPEQSRAAMSIERGKLAAGIKDPEARRRFIARQGNEEAKGKSNLSELEQENFRERNRQEAQKTLDTLDTGGNVRRDGLYNLARGEQVLPATPISKPTFGFNPVRPRPAPAAPQSVPTTVASAMIPGFGQARPTSTPAPPREAVGAQGAPSGSAGAPLGARPVIASFDSIKSPRTVLQSGVYRLKRGEKVIPACPEAPDSRVKRLREKQLDKTAPYQGN
jgi:hypothetical protein